MSRGSCAACLGGSKEENSRSLSSSIFSDASAETSAETSADTSEETGGICASAAALSLACVSVRGGDLAALAPLATPSASSASSKSKRPSLGAPSAAGSPLERLRHEDNFEERSLLKRPREDLTCGESAAGASRGGVNLISGDTAAAAALGEAAAARRAADCFAADCFDAERISRSSSTALGLEGVRVRRAGKAPLCDAEELSIRETPSIASADEWPASKSAAGGGARLPANSRGAALRLL